MDAIFWGLLCLLIISAWWYVNYQHRKLERQLNQMRLRRLEEISLRRKKLLLTPDLRPKTPHLHLVKDDYGDQV